MSYGSDGFNGTFESLDDFVVRPVRASEVNHQRTCEVANKVCRSLSTVAEAPNASNCALRVDKVLKLSTIVGSISSA